ncbi:MAG TPA: glycosyltransferase family 39 protein [Terriglobia bacterium]|nr:glycosyltransferase family 39 protein [Terriglobia bacterium]
MDRRIFPLACALYLIAANLVWIARDNRPPFWDMAYHQTAALRIVNAFSEHGITALAGVPSLSGFYPPVYHSIVAVFYAIFGASPRVGQLANIPAVFLLIFSTYAIARSLMAPVAAFAAVALVTFYPLLVWMSRAAMIDYWLAGLVAFAMWVLLCTDGLTKRRTAIAFGLICGIGLLTKLSFAAFVGLPALWAARGRWKNALLAGAVALAMAATWYAPHWNTFMTFYGINASGGVAEGDPARLSWQSLVFYARAMEGYQLFLPLFVLFLIGAVCLARRFDERWFPIALWIAGGWLGLLLIQNKDPRYSMPLLAAVALISARLFERRTAWLIALVPFLLFQHFLISFGVPALPDQVVLAQGIPGNPTWNWNLYSQSYAGLWGPPITADWPVDDVIERVSAESGGNPVCLALIPDIPSFDLQSFEYEILLRRAPVTVTRFASPVDVDRAGCAYMLLTLEAPGARMEKFDELDQFHLPGGQLIGLFRTNR